MADVRLADIATVNWSLKVGELGQVVEDHADIAQSIRNILLTARGSAPLRPDFGSDLYQSIDKPIDQAGPAMVRDTHEALRAWEPRAIVERVVPTYSGSGEGLTITVTWRPAFEAAAGARDTAVRL